ncbi:MAG: lysyl-tRNA synthetase, class, partial [Thermoleophilaceae bacterium]|nr:lysyl-tRNA synthetase, class [Thermoleophilaceae bacterium]
MNAVVSARARLARIACGIATIVVGALSVISALTPDVPWRRHLLVAVEPGSVMRLGHVLALVGGVALAYLGLGVAAGKRRAASIGTGALVALGVLHLVKGLDYEEAGVTFGLAGLLWASRGACHRGASAAGALLAAAVALGAAAAAYTLDVATFLPSDDLGSAL